MNRIVLVFLVFCVFGIPVLAGAEIVDRVVAVVAGEVITLSELDDYVALYGMSPSLEGKNALERSMLTAKVRRTVLDQVLEDKVIEKAARRYGVKITTTQTDTALEQIRQRSKLSEEEFERQLAEDGFSVERYRQFLQGQLRRKEILDSVIKPKVSMDDDSLQEYYREHIDDYRRPPRVRVSHVFVRLAPDAPEGAVEAAQAKAAEALDELRAGQSFEDVAMRYSEDPSAASGGDLGYFREGEMIPAFEEVLFDMEAGAVTGIIQSPQGLHVLKLTEKELGVPYSFDEVRNQMMMDYFDKEFQHQYIEWLDEMKDLAEVEDKL
jgi:peptidyl-prolyl cis-trans isomerase SurA